MTARAPSLELVDEAGVMEDAVEVSPPDVASEGV